MGTQFKSPILIKPQKLISQVSTTHYPCGRIQVTLKQPKLLKFSQLAQQKLLEIIASTLSKHSGTTLFQDATGTITLKHYCEIVSEPDSVGPENQENSLTSDARIQRHKITKNPLKGGQVIHSMASTASVTTGLPISILVIVVFQQKSMQSGQ